MRTKPLFGLLILGVAAIVIIPAITSGQPGNGYGGRKGGGQRGGGGGGGYADPSALFDRYAKGQPYVLISNLRMGQDIANQYAKDKGITSGRLNRAQFIEFQQQVSAKMFASMGRGGGKGPFGGGFNFKKKGGGPNGGNTAAPPSPDFINSLAEADFRRRDANGDGKLNNEEMPGRLRANLGKWDTNHDGLIDLAEYRDYYRDSIAARFGGGDGADKSTPNIASIVIDDDELDRKTVVFRAGPGGKMPAGLPAWFLKLDTDGDGQVALFEWRQGGKDLDEFKDWDLNDDGLITPEEAVKVQITLGKDVTKDSTASRGEQSMRFGPPNGNRRFNFDPSQFPNRGKGGNNGKGKGKGKNRGYGN